MNAAGDLLQLLEHVGQTRHRLGEHAFQVIPLGWHRLLGQAKFQSQRDKPLLGSVVNIAFQAASGVVGGGHNPRPRGDQLRAGGRGRNCGRHQLGELDDACLGIRRQRVGFSGGDDGNSPQPLIHHNRGPDARPDAQLANAFGNGAGGALPAVHPRRLSRAQYHGGDVVTLGAKAFTQ